MKIDVVEAGRLYRAQAPAKLNLFFEILGKRSDGFHEIETLVAPIDLYDRLEFQFCPSATFEVEVECFDEKGRPSAAAPSDETNLVARAARAFWEKANEFQLCDHKTRLRVKIFKKIPTKAGLGGGSSDAAATLLVLAKHAGAAVLQSSVRALASRLGSDVPLFLERGASIGRGRGERVEAFELPEIWTAVVKPTASLSTPEVYREYSRSSHSSARSLEKALRTIRASRGGDVVGATARVAFNRLEESAAVLWDGLARWKKALSSIPSTLAAQMTGSGSALFAIYPDEACARRAADEIRRISEQDDSGCFQIEDAFVARTTTADD